MVDKTILNRMLNSTGFTKFIRTWNIWIDVFLAVGTITTIIMIIFHIVKIAQAGDNPGKRSEAQKDLITCIICFAILGCIDIVYVLILNFVMGTI